MNGEMKMGMAAGIMVGLLVVGILLFFKKKGGRKKCEFDERQELIRGKGFKIGFFSMVICNTIVGCYSMAVEKPMVDMFTSSVFSILIGGGVFAVYCIWKDAYFSLNENRKKMLILFAGIAICNFSVLIPEYASGDSVLMEDGVLQPGAINIMCGILYVVIFVTFLAKEIVERKEK